MKKSFEEWLNGTPDPKPEPQAKEKPPEKYFDYDAELPPGVDFGDSPGTYLYQCRGCGNWYPMDWDLAEDDPDRHYCRRYGCVSMPTPAVPKRVVMPPRKRPAGAPTDAQMERAHKEYQRLHGYFPCPGCGMVTAMCDAKTIPGTNLYYCGSDNCYVSIQQRLRC